jgi:hypothetical protein
MVWIIVFILFTILVPEFFWHLVGVTIIILVHIWEKGGSMF